MYVPLLEEQGTFHLHIYTVPQQKREGWAQFNQTLNNTFFWGDQIVQFNLCEELKCKDKNSDNTQTGQQRSSDKLIRW